jgi:chemotaxis protein methyltransferase CheR
MITLRPEEQRPVTDYIYSICSIVLDSSKGYLIEGRLSHVAEEFGCRTFTDLLAKARGEVDGAVKRKMIAAITTGETFFFRDVAPFDLLRQKVFPELIERRKRLGATTPIRVWSAACSSGQEIYSVAMILKELLGDPFRYGVRMLGTDISDDAVARASKGIFTQLEMERGLSDAQRSRHFVPVGGGWKIADELRALATFKRVNLMQDFSSLGKFDVILCRNVAIYFSDADRVSLFGRIERVLEREGTLIVGSMESLSGVCPQFEAHRHQRAVCYKLKGAGQAPVSTGFDAAKCKPRGN